MPASDYVVEEGTLSATKAMCGELAGHLRTVRPGRSRGAVGGRARLLALVSVTPLRKSLYSKVQPPTRMCHGGELQGFL